jgi:hypothetical protein
MEGVMKAIAATGAWATPRQIADRTNLSESEVMDTLAELDVDGCVSVIQRDGEVAVTLTPKGATLLGVQLIDKGDSTAAWVQEDAPIREFLETVDIRHLGQPVPKILLGQSFMWSNKCFDTCPVCKGLPLQTDMYCLYCNRWGRDADSIQGRIAATKGRQGVLPAATT